MQTTKTKKERGRGNRRHSVCFSVFLGPVPRISQLRLPTANMECGRSRIKQDVSAAACVGNKSPSTTRYRCALWAVVGVEAFLESLSWECHARCRTVFGALLWQLAERGL